MKMFLKKIQKNSLGASLYEWKSDLSGYAIREAFISRHLLPTHRKAVSIPCSNCNRRCGGCQRLKVATFGSEVRAFCPNRKVPDVQLEKSSLIEYELNIASFTKELVEKIGFEPLKTVEEGKPCTHIAMSKINPRKRIPVYLAMYPYADRIEDALKEVLYATTGAFVLLTMEPVTDSSIIEKMSQRQVSVLDLADILSFDDAGEIAVIERAAIKNDIKAQTPKEQKKQIDLPPGIGWEQLQFTFPDNHTLNVTIGDRCYMLTYDQLGMRGHGTKTSVQWNLLRAFSYGCGEIEDAIPDGAKRKQVELLNKILCDTFKLTEHPIKRVHSDKCYRMKVHMPGEGASSVYHHKYRQ